MADKTLAQLTAASTVNLTDSMYVVQGANSRRATVQQLQDAIGATDASGIAVDNTNLQVAHGADLQTYIEANDTALLNARTTGVRYGGDVSAVSGLDVSVATGAGQILDNTDPTAPIHTALTWETQTVTLAGNGITWLYFDDDSGTVKQTMVEPTYSTRTTRMYLARCVVRSGALVALAQDKDYIQNIGPQLRALAEAIGQIRISGLGLSANGANLSFNIASGVMFDFGVNGITDPHQIAITAKTAATFQYIKQTGESSGTNVTVIDPTQYDVSGVLTTVSNNKYTIQDVYVFSSQNVRLQYGQNQYNSLSEAVSATRTRSNYVTNPLLGLGLRLGAIVAKKEATALNDTATAQFVLADKFGGF